jgi:polyisoprenoid-binding protein YceI
MIRVHAAGRAAVVSASLSLLTHAADVAPRSLRIDPARSALSFTIHRPGETIDGTAAEFSGEVVFDPERPDRSAVRLRVTAASLSTGNGLRDRKMRKTHLEVESFSGIVFESTSIRLSGERRALVNGTLSLHGVERAILFPATIRYDTGSLTAEGELELKLSDHGIPIPRFLWMVLDDAVTVRFRIVAGDRRAGEQG